MEVSYTVLSVIVGVTLLLAQILNKVIDFVIDKISPASDKSILTQSDVLALRRLVMLHERTDDDGVPLWYVPRSLATTIKDMSAILISISHSQESTAKTLDKVAVILEAIDRRQAILEGKHE